MRISVAGMSHRMKRSDPTVYALPLSAAVVVLFVIVLSALMVLL
jgi:hypothetical protein